MGASETVEPEAGSRRSRTVGLERNGAEDDAGFVDSGILRNGHAIALANPQGRDAVNPAPVTTSSSAREGAGAQAVRTKRTRAVRKNS